MGGDGVLIDGHAGGVVDGVADGGRTGAGRGLAQGLGTEGTGGLGVLHELRLQMGVIHDGGELVVQQVIVQRPAGLFVEQQLLRQAVADGHGHTAVDLRLCQRRVHQLAAVVDVDVGLSTLYMRIYFMGMPFFMLYNYGAAILRAVGDTKRPLYFLIIAGVINAGLNMVLVIVFGLGVAGVGIATVFSQMVSCVLVLTCLCRTEGSYKLSFSKLSMKGYYLKQIFQVGIPAGIQSTVINFSNALLQSSVNSFGSTAMAGYTAANNILGFLYVSINSVTQACMSFTSQNFGVGKYKRMDRVLIDCMILSVGAALVLGCGAYFFGAEILQIYTEEADVIQCGVEILSITTVPYFLCGIMDLFPGALRGMGYSAVPMVLSIIGTVGMRVLWIFAFFPQHRSLYFLFISYPASWIATIVMQVVCYYFVRKHCYK